MLPVTIQHQDGVTYHFYHAKDSCARKGSRIIISKIDESKASRFISLFSFEDLSKIYKLLPKKDLERAFPKKHIVKALTAGTLLVYEEGANSDSSETEMALLRLEIKMILNQILSVEIAEAAGIEKSLENKNAVQKILLYKREYDKGFVDAGVEFLTWIKDIYEVVSPTENLKRALDAGWETYKADSPEWKQIFADKLKASNYKEVIDALGFDPDKLSTEKIVEVFESAKLIYDDEKTQQIILKFIRDYAGAQHSLEWANFIGSAAFDIVLTALLAFATGGIGAVASAGSKTGRLMKPLAKLGEKFVELAKRLRKRFKPKEKKKTSVGGSKNNTESNSKNNDGKKFGENAGGLEVGEATTYENHNSRAVVGDDLEGNHIPAIKQVIKSEERKRGRPLTREEKAELKKKTSVLVEPKDVHAKGATWRGRNTKTRIEEDSLDLKKAAERDTEKTKEELLKEGYDESHIDKEIDALHNANEELNVYHPEKPIPLSTDK